SRGEVMNAISNVAALKTTTVAGSKINETQALKAALAKLYPTLKDQLSPTGRDGNTVIFNKTSFFHEQPSVEKTAILMTNGSLKTGFVVTTWSEKKNLLHETLVDGAGNIQEDLNRTANDSYNVFTKDPISTPQSVVAGPGSGNAQSPAGWVFSGDQLSV